MDQPQHSSSQETGLEDVTTAELHNAFIAAAQMDLHTAMPCQVVSYDAATQTVTVTPAQNRAVPDGAGNFISEALPQLSDVPVGFYSAGGCALTLPVSAGDYGMLIVCERNIGSWRGTGNQGDPGDLGMHTLDGAVFYPTLRPDKAALQSADATNMVIGRDANTSARIIVKASEIDIGAAAANFVAMADKTIARLQAIVSGFNGHTHPYLNATTPATTSPPTVPLATPAPVASTNLKAEE